MGSGYRRTLSITMLLVVSVLILLIGFYFLKIQEINKIFHQQDSIEKEVALRKFPYPFKAAMTICSDLDQTGTLEEYLEIQKFVSTNENTSMGKGLGLNIGNSFFFYEPPSDSISMLTSICRPPSTVTWAGP